MQGYLKKKSNNPLKKWQTRYFDLNRHILTYYETAPSPDEKQEPKGEFNMKAMRSLGMDPGNKLVIVLNLETWDNNSLECRTLHIKCPDNNFYQAWLSCFVVFVSQDFKRCMIPTTFAGPVWILIDYLSRPDIARTEGLFRIPGEKSTTDSLRNKFIIRHIALTPTNHAIKLSQYPITALSSVLKCLIDRMPHTLLTERFYEDFIALYHNSRVQNRLSKIRALLLRLPCQSIAYIQHLCLCLNRVSKTPGNKMDAKTLGILFGTMFASRLKSPLESMHDYQPLQHLLEDLVLHYEELFVHDPPKFEPVVPKLQLVLTNNWCIPKSVSSPRNIKMQKNTLEKFISRLKWRRKKKNNAFICGISTSFTRTWGAQSQIILPHREIKLPELSFDESSTSDIVGKGGDTQKPVYNKAKTEVQSTSVTSSASEVIRRPSEYSYKRHSSYIPTHSSVYNLDSAEMKRSEPKKKIPMSSSVENSRNNFGSDIHLDCIPISHLVTPVNRYALGIPRKTDDDDSSAFLGEALSLDELKLDCTESRKSVESSKSKIIYL